MIPKGQVTRASIPKESKASSSKYDDSAKIEQKVQMKPVDFDMQNAEKLFNNCFPQFIDFLQRNRENPKNNSMPGPSGDAQPI